MLPTIHNILNKGELHPASITSAINRHSSNLATINNRTTHQENRK